MASIKEGYLFRLWHYDKRLFVFVSVFVLGTASFNLLGFECSPFFVWAMFSEKEHVQERYSCLELEADGERLPIKSELWEANEHFLMGSLSYYQRIIDNEGVDPTHKWLAEKIPGPFARIEPFYRTISLQEDQFDDFEKWAKSYAAYSFGRQIDHLKVSNIELKYEKGRPIKVAKELLFEE